MFPDIVKDPSQCLVARRWFSAWFSDHFTGYFKNINETKEKKEKEREREDKSAVTPVTPQLNDAWHFNWPRIPG